MNTGETMLTDANRATVFVNAKRAGITITTKAVGKQTEVTKTGEISAPVVIPKLKPQKTLLDQIKELSSSERVTLFEHFELCCGMNRGECICEPETVEIAKPLPTITDNRKDVLNALQAKIDAIESGSSETKTAPVDNSWIEMPQTIENGETLYWHRKIKGVPVCYKRETNWDSFA